LQIPFTRRLADQLVPATRNIGRIGRGAEIKIEMSGLVSGFDLIIASVLTKVAGN